MKLKPIRFIGHKIGPFEHIELNWPQDKESRHTLIVGENGMGKTTLVAAMADCLLSGGGISFQKGVLERFAQDEHSWAGFVVEFEDELGWLFKSQSNDMRTNIDIINLVLLANLSVLDKNRPVESFPTDYRYRLSENLRAIYQGNFLSIENIKFLLAAYGVNRDIEHHVITEYKGIRDKNPLESLLNPFAKLESSDILQSVFNKHTESAFAKADGDEKEAKEHRAAIERMEEALKELGQPINFQVNRNPLELNIKQNGTTLSVNQLSDGTRNFLGWPLDYLMRASRLKWADPKESAIAPGLVIVDEIDSHLHPEWQRRIMPILSKLLPETHIIATTHSPFVLGSTDDAQIFKIERGKDGKLTARSFDELHGYPADLVLEKAFVPSLYPPDVEQDLERLSDLARKVASGEISDAEKEEHDTLLTELAEVSPWLDSLLALKQATQGGVM